MPAGSIQFGFMSLNRSLKSELGQSFPLIPPFVCGGTPLLLVFIGSTRQEFASPFDFLEEKKFEAHL